MTPLYQLVASKDTGEVSSFAVKDGDVSIGNTLLVKHFNDNLILVFEKDAVRLLKSVDDMITFGTLITNLRDTGKVLSMQDNMNKFMDPDARFYDYLTTGESFGLTRATESLRLAYKAVREEFEAAFTPPVPPRTLATPITLTEDDQKWLDNTSNRVVQKDNPFVDRLAAVRLGYKDGVVTRLLTSEYSLRVEDAKRLWDNHLNRLWREAPQTTDRLRGYIQGGGGFRGYDTTIYGNRVEIGCQSISRWSVERVAQLLGWDM